MGKTFSSILKEHEIAAAQEAVKETAKDMLADNMPMEKIAKYTHLSMDQIRELVTAN